MRFVMLLLLSQLGVSFAYAMDLAFIQKNAFKIIRVTDDVVVVPGNLKKGQNVLMVRLKAADDEYEVICNGIVKKPGTNGTTGVTIDIDNLKKLPTEKDFAVVLAPPKEFDKPVKPPKEDDLKLQLDKPPETELGYFHFFMDQLDSNLLSNTPNEANSFKNISKYSRSGMGFEWFFEFLPNYGLRIRQGSGNVPIFNYYHEEVPAASKAFDLRLMYRTLRVDKTKPWRITGFFESVSDDFSTLNDDHNVVATKITSTNIGARVTYEMGDLLLTSKKSSFRWTDAHLELGMMLSGKAVDGIVSRGSSGNVKGFDFRFGTSWTTYQAWVPWVKRYTFGVEGFQTTRTMTFSGPTRSEFPTIGYQVPEGGSYGEKEQGIRLIFGMRFEDIVGRALKPKE